jgi:hypothetical protein
MARRMEGSRNEMWWGVYLLLNAAGTQVIALIGPSGYAWWVGRVMQNSVLHYPAAPHGWDASFFKHASA